MRLCSWLGTPQCGVPTHGLLRERGDRRECHSRWQHGRRAHEHPVTLSGNLTVLSQLGGVWQLGQGSGKQKAKQKAL